MWISPAGRSSASCRLNHSLRGQGGVGSGEFGGGRGGAGEEGWVLLRARVARAQWRGAPKRAPHALHHQPVGQPRHGHGHAANQRVRADGALVVHRDLRRVRGLHLAHDLFIPRGRGVAIVAHGARDLAAGRGDDHLRRAGRGGRGGGGWGGWGVAAQRRLPLLRRCTGACGRKEKGARGTHVGVHLAQRDHALQVARLHDADVQLIELHGVERHGVLLSRLP